LTSSLPIPLSIFQSGDSRRLNTSVQMKILQKSLSPLGKINLLLYGRVRA
jgi:hypothetical protein